MRFLFLVSCLILTLPSHAINSQCQFDSGFKIIISITEEQKHYRLKASYYDLDKDLGTSTLILTQMNLNEPIILPTGNDDSAVWYGDHATYQGYFDETEELGTCVSTSRNF